MSAPQPPRTVLDALRDSPAGPFLDMPLPQLPPAPVAGPPPGMPGLPELPQLPPLPPLPTDPIGALLHGAALPALPGVDQMLKPLTDLVSGFGSGSFGGFDPTQLFQQSSSLIDSAMQMGMSGLKTLDQVWQGSAAQNAQTSGQQAQGSGAEVSQRGTDIASVTRDAADSVARGNAKLTAIAESFVSQAVATAPMVFTPPGQAALMATAAEHLTQAIAVVSETRAELTGHTAKMGALADPVAVPAGPSAGATGGPSPFAIASQVMEGVGKPLMSLVSEGIQTVSDGATHAASLGVDPSAASTTPAGLSHSGSGGAGGGSHGGGGMLGGITGSMSGGGSGGSSPGRQLSGASLSGSGPQGGTQPSEAGKTGAAAGASAAAAGAAGTGGGMVPPMARGGAGGGDEEHRSNTGYLSDAINNSDLVGDLGKVSSPVLGAPDPGDPVADLHEYYD